MDYPIYLSQIMLRHQEVPIHQITQLGIISVVYKYPVFIDHF